MSDRKRFLVKTRGPSLRFTFAIARKISFFATLLPLCLAPIVLTSCRQEVNENSTQHRGLIVGTVADVSATGAFQARLGVYPLNTNVAETLVHLSPNYEVEPLLAERWEYRGENTWRFFLRHGIRFHDGQEFTARAVQSSIAQHVKGGSGYSFLDENSIKIVDDYTVDITPTQPNLPLPQQLVHPNYSIFAPNTDPTVKPVGTGPFRWVEYKRDERIIVERNDEYWGTKALPERITFRFFPDATTRVLALLAGEVDLITDLPREQVSTVNARPDLTVSRAPVGLILSLQINAHGQGNYDLLSDRTLRKAIGLSLNRQELIQKVWGGEGSDVQNMTVPAILGASAGIVHGFAYDTKQAAQLLDDDGWRIGQDGVRLKNGRRLELVLVANTELDTGTVEFVQAQLRQSGMDVHWVKLPDIGTYASRLNAGEFDLNLATSNQNDGNPLFLPALIYYSKSGRPFARWYQAGEEFDRVVEEGMRASDPAEVQRLAAEAIHIAIDDEAVNVPVAGVFRLYALKKTVEGFVPHPSQTNQSWAQVTIK
jgi:peptide/nickel transport system substrate-binding protein